MEQPLDIFSENREIRATTYIVDDFEGAAFRFTPLRGTYQVFIKWQGKREKQIDRTRPIVGDALLGGRVISENEYNVY